MPKFRALLSLSGYKKNKKRGSGTVIIEDSGDIVVKNAMRIDPLGNILDITKCEVKKKQVILNNKQGDNIILYFRKIDIKSFTDIINSNKSDINERSIPNDTKEESLPDGTEERNIPIEKKAKKGCFKKILIVFGIICGVIIIIGIIVAVVGKDDEEKAVDTTKSTELLNDDELQQIVEKNFNSYNYNEVFNEDSINAKMSILNNLYTKLNIDASENFLLLEAEWFLAIDYYSYYIIKHEDWPKIWPVFIRKWLELIRENREIIEEDDKGSDFYDAVSLLLTMRKYGDEYEKSIAVSTINALKKKELWEPLKKEAIRFAKKYPDIYKMEDIEE